ncbi:unnamed protein product [Leptidea sinapis]|uniref:MalT-like TPR region domain-containing protein n=2 Tax=Leptidea sinapis TaxID=189913 RepID=A0A5E4R377_9NEOP|nr:unnamed protein product [Leptidea sinapis]
MNCPRFVKPINVSFTKIPVGIKVPSTLSFSILTLIGLEKIYNAEDELILTIKHCVLFIQRGEYDKAEKLLHVALKQAQLMQHQSGITYVYDVMANLALQMEQLDKAKKLFVAVAQRVMGSGASEDDPRVVHINLKLARVCHLQKDYITAQLGYDWCLEKLNAQVDPSNDYKMLIAMAEDWYGRLFVECNKCEQGYKYMLSAYNRMRDFKDMEVAHIVVQLNDLGTVCEKMDNLDDSIKYISEAIELGKTQPDMEDLGIMYVNLGRAYMKKQLLTMARKNCGHALRLGILNKNSELKKEAELCMQEINS